MDDTDAIGVTIIALVLLISISAIFYAINVETDVPNDNDMLPTDIETLLEHQYGVELYTIKDTGHIQNDNSITFWGTAITSTGEYMFTYNSSTGETSWIEVI